MTDLLPVGEQRIVGRKTGGTVEDLDGAEVMAILTGQNGADFDVNSHKLTNVTDPGSAQDAATKAYVDGLASNYDAAGTAAGLSRSAIAYAMWTLLRERTYRGADPLTVDWSTVADDAVEGAWLLAISWQSFQWGPDPSSGGTEIRADGGTVLAITKHGPTVLFAALDDADNPLVLNLSSFTAGDATNDRYDIIYVQVTDLDAGTYTPEIWNGTPGDDYATAYAAFNAQKGDYDCASCAVVVPANASDWGDCYTDTANDPRHVVAPIISFSDSDPQRMWIPTELALGSTPGRHASIRIQHGEHDDSTFVFKAYVDDTNTDTSQGLQATDKVGVFGSQLAYSDRPVLDLSSLDTSGETDAVQAIATALQSAIVAGTSFGIYSTGFSVSGVLYDENSDPYLLGGYLAAYDSSGGFLSEVVQSSTDDGTFTLSVNAASGTDIYFGVFQWDTDTAHIYTWGYDTPVALTNNESPDPIGDGATAYNITGNVTGLSLSLLPTP